MWLAARFPPLCVCIERFAIEVARGDGFGKRRGRDRAPWSRPSDMAPGLRWDRLEIWENSASHDVWTRLSEYVEFRSYVLGALGSRMRSHTQVPKRSLPETR